jgi:hypothetical protein
MSRPTATDRARRQVVEDHDARANARVRALKKMRRPSREFLLSIMRDPSNPSRLLYMAAELLDDGDRLRAARRKAMQATGSTDDKSLGLNEQPTTNDQEKKQ